MFDFTMYLSREDLIIQGATVKRIKMPMISNVRTEYLGLDNKILAENDGMGGSLNLLMVAYKMMANGPSILSLI